MVADKQVRRLREMLSRGKTLVVSALASGMDLKTARKYRDSNKFPSELKQDRYWRTRLDPYEAVWPKIGELLENNHGLEATTIFDWLQRKYPGKYQDGQLRTLQRKIKHWRATEGPSKEVMFPQKHYPGELGQSDFTHMEGLGVTINHIPFKHLVFHFVLTWSNWEAGSICYSETLESLADGLQDAFWKLGGVPRKHQTDRLSAAINNLSDIRQFTDRYEALMNHYSIAGQKTQPASPHENGDVEQSHFRFKKAVDQALMLRGHRDFASLEEYRQFIDHIFEQRNKGRLERFKEELKHLSPLPHFKIDMVKQNTVRVGPGSTIRVDHSVYSVHSRLIGESVTAFIHQDKIVVQYGGRTVHTFPRLAGNKKHRIDYRHIIDSLIRKPGAFKNYRYKSDLFPNIYFRLAYDLLSKELPNRCDKEYLNILHLAATCSENRVTEILNLIIDQNLPLSAKIVRQYFAQTEASCQKEDVTVLPVNIADYDVLLPHREASHGK
jgi:hypothetical protein